MGIIKKFFYLVLAAVLLPCIAHAQQTTTISGKVTDEAGNALPNASVFIQNLNTGGRTDDAGNYAFTIPASRANGQTTTLTARLIGHTARTAAVTLTPGQAIVENFVLPVSAMQLAEVLVTGMGTTSTRERIGSAINVVDSSIVRRATQPQNIVSALAGTAPNVEVRTQSGEPGASASIKIRGNASLTGTNQPLFIVDGQPIDNSTTSTNGGDFSTVTQNRAADINPNDIESVNILKGSAAAAIYGARAANGVILITTKSGHVGPTRWTVSSTETWDHVTAQDILQHDYAQGSGGVAAVCDGLDCRPDRRSWGPKIAAGAPSFNHINDIYRTGLTADNVASVSGGNDRTTFYASGGLTSQGGVIVGPNNRYDRATARLKGTQVVNSKLQVGGNFSYIDTRGRYVQKGSNVSGLLLGALRTPPSFNNSDYLTASGLQRPYRFPNPSSADAMILNPAYYDNPIFTANTGGNRSELGRSIANADITYTPNEWLTIKNTLGGDYFSDWRLEALPVTSANDVTGDVTRFDFNNLEIDNNLTAAARRSFGAKADVTLTLGQNLNSRRYRQLYNFGETLIAPSPLAIQNTVTVIGSEFRSLQHVEGYFAQLEGYLLNQIDINVGIRNDGFSTFGQSKRRNNFPKAAISWIFTNALGNTDQRGVLSFGKLRAAYGETGKEPPVYGSVTALSSQSTFGGGGYGDAIKTTLGGQGGLVTGATVGNPALRPERSRESEFGTDLGFLDQRVDLSFTAYNKRTGDVILANLPVNASETGAFQAVQNGASLTNKGVELSINARALNLNNFDWNLGFVFGKNRGNVTGLLGAEYIPYNNEGFTGAIGSSTLGYAPGVIRGKDFAICGRGLIISGVDIDQACGANQNGALYLAANGQPLLDPTDRVIADPNPKYTMGFNSSIKVFKRITFSGLLDVRKGGQVWNGTRGILDYFGTSKDTDIRNTTNGQFGVNFLTDKFPRVAGPGKGVVAFTTPAAWQTWFTNNGGGFGPVGSQFIDDGSFVKLRELSMAFNVGGNLLRNIGGFSSADIRIAGRNLHTWTRYKGFDPEANLGGAEFLTQGLDYFNSPQTRSFVLSISLNR